MLLWTGQVVSTVGSRVTSLAAPLLVLALTHSPTKAGIVGFTQTLPYPLFYLLAGALVDRWNRKALMLACDAGRAVAIATIPLALWLGWISIAQIMIVAFIDGTLFVFFSLAESSALPQIVRKQQLPTAIAQNQAREQGAALIGQPLGAVLFGISRSLPFVADAVSYAVSLIALTFIRPAFQEKRTPVQTQLRTEIAEGVRWLWRQSFLRAAVMLIAGANFVLNGLVLALIVRAKELGFSSATIGAIFAFYGGAAVTGSLIAPFVQRRLSERVIVLGAPCTWALGIATLAFLPNAVALGTAYGLTALTGPVFNVVLASYRYALVPDRLLGRVGSVARVFGWGTIPLASLSTGLLLDSIGGVRTLLTLSGLMFAVAIGSFLSPSLRSLPRVQTLLTPEKGLR